MTPTRFLLAVLLAIVFVPSVARSDSSATMPDAVQHDPAPALRPPASMEELAILSHSARINGLMYIAAGSGPHPIVIFLHGYPGNERNLDLAQAVRRAGYNAIFVDYRGVFGSGGTFCWWRRRTIPATKILSGMQSLRKRFVRRAESLCAL